MKIIINKEMYYTNPCPKITKEIWDWFYGNFHRNFMNRNHKGINKIETIHIRINQAYKGCSNIHFYVTINKELNNSFEFHMCYGLASEPPYFKRYRWMVDLIYDNIDIGTRKPMERYERSQEILKLKRNTKRNVSRLINEYKTYLNLHEKFNYCF